MSVITVLGGQTQQQADKSKAETIARQYQQGQKVPAQDIAWVAKNYPALLQRGTEKSYSPAAAISYQPKVAAPSWRYTAGQEYAATHPPPTFTGVPTGITVKLLDVTPKLVSGVDVLGSISKGLRDLGASLLQRGLAGTMLEWQVKPILQEAKIVPPPSSFPLISQMAYVARKAGAQIETPTVRPLGMAAGIIAPFESLAYAVPRLLGVKTPTPPPTMLGGLIGMPFGSKEFQKAMGYGPEYGAGTLLGEYFLGVGLGKLGAAAWEKLPERLTSPLEKAGGYAWEKTGGQITSRVSERAEEYLTSKYVSSMKGLSTYIEEGGEPTVEGALEWRGLPEKIVSFVTGAKPHFAVGEVSIPEVPFEEQIRLGLYKEPRDVAMQALDFTVAPRMGGVAYTKQAITAAEEATKLPIYFGIGKEIFPEAELISERTGFEKGAVEKWSDIGKMATGSPPAELGGAFEKVPYRAGFAAQYGFEKPFFPPEVGLTPLVTQTQLTRMGIFPDIPQIPDLTEDVGSHLGSITAMGGALLSRLSLSLALKPLSKSFEESITIPTIMPSLEERVYQVPIVAPITVPREKEIVVPRLIIPSFPPPTTTPEKGLPPALWPRLGGGERTFETRRMKGLWIPRIHAIPSFGMVAAHFGIKGFGTRGITGDRFGMDKSLLHNQSSIAGYGKRGPVRVSNKVPTSYKGMRMKDRLKRHEKTERKLRLENGLSYPAAHRRALRAEHKGLSRKQIHLYEGKIRSIKSQIANTKGDPFKRLLEKIAA